jgi:hypothetical protein
VTIQSAHPLIVSEDSQSAHPLIGKVGQRGVCCEPCSPRNRVAAAHVSLLLLLLLLMQPCCCCCCCCCSFACSLLPPPRLLQLLLLQEAVCLCVADSPQEREEVDLRPKVVMAAGQTSLGGGAVLLYLPPGHLQQPTVKITTVSRHRQIHSQACCCCAGWTGCCCCCWH